MGRRAIRFVGSARASGSRISRGSRLAAARTVRPLAVDSWRLRLRLRRRGSQRRDARNVLSGAAHASRLRPLSVLQSDEHRRRLRGDRRSGRPRRSRSGPTLTRSAWPTPTTSGIRAAAHSAVDVRVWRPAIQRSFRSGDARGRERRCVRQFARVYWCLLQLCGWRLGDAAIYPGARGARFGYVELLLRF